MNFNVEGERVHIDLTPAELHVVHAALHSYGDHQLGETLARDDRRMATEFREQLQAVARWAVEAADALGTPCGEAFRHADGQTPDAYPPPSG